MSGTTGIEGRVVQHSPIKIYSKQNGQQICVDANCQLSPNHAAQTLYESATDVYAFFLTQFGLNGVDGMGTIPPFYIDWNENNAAWACRLSGENCVWQFNNRYVYIPEVACHEWFHAIEHVFSNLNRTGQPGALKEAGGDVFAIAFKHWRNPGSAKDWSVGGLRNLQDHHEMVEYNPAADVHENCKIPTHAFYAATLEYGDVTYGVVAKIWFNAFIGLPSNSSFKIFASRTFYLAPEEARSAIVKSWLHVGVFQLKVDRPIDQRNSIRGN